MFPASRMLARSVALFLPTILLGCPNEETQKLPHFSERVHLEVSAWWTDDRECLDVIFETNLPEGTTVLLRGQRRRPPGHWEERDRLYSAQYQTKLVVSAPRHEYERVFCDTHEAPLTNHEVGMLLEVSVGGPDTKVSSFNDPHDYTLQRQEIGPKGDKLKGPLVQERLGSFIATSETFVLPGTRQDR